VAVQAKAARVGAGHVAEALARRERRLNLVEEEVQRLIEEQTLAIETSGMRVGQVNGLAVSDLGDYAFARPTRITASVGMGREGVVNVEREVDLSGAVHSKGVLTLTGYLLEKYAQNLPLTLAARLTFEQTYGRVDGDSASCAELCALLSQIAAMPLDQGIAMTGSLDQDGNVQAVGGVTAKVEGFFAVCKAQGLTGDQGVVLPEANARHLMLKPEVVEAVQHGMFHVWTMRTIDEGLQLLTGLPAGLRRRDGSFPRGSLHALVQQRLTTLARRFASFPEKRRARRSGRSGSPGRDGWHKDQPQASWHPPPASPPLPG
jgi:Lon-like ATP-dependent protease